MDKRIRLYVCCCSILIQALFWVGCKNATAADRSSEGVVVCDLKEVQADAVPESSCRDWIIRRMGWKTEGVLLIGQMKIEETDFTVVLSENYRRIFLCESPGRVPACRWELGELRYIWKVKGRYYEFLIADDQSRCLVRPCTEPTGRLRLEKGDRPIETVTFQGLLKSDDAEVAFHDFEQGKPVESFESSVPVGNYLAYGLRVHLDDLEITLHSIFEPEIDENLNLDIPLTYPVHIRENQLCKLAFSETPEILFYWPMPDSNKERIKAGQEIRFMPLLLDPRLNMIIPRMREMVEMSRELQHGGRTERVYVYESDGTVARRGRELEYHVKLCNAAGSVLAEEDVQLEGDFRWQVPADIELADGEEIWTVTVSFDTGCLYGEVSGRREVTITH